jgi:hypothetical protein
MIQRIQSLFLFAAVVLQLVFISSSLAHFLLADSRLVDFYCTGFISTSGTTVSPIFNTTVIAIMSWAITLICISAIFLYKKRKLQMRICIYTILLIVCLIALLTFYYLQFKADNAIQTSAFTLSMAIPVVNIIILLLAFRGIRKDEQLVKAYDRLR